jgi:lysozyme family protein
MDSITDVDHLIEALIEREGVTSTTPTIAAGRRVMASPRLSPVRTAIAGAMAELPQGEAMAIYRRLSWLRPRFDVLAKRVPHVAAELFDTGANMGPGVAVTFLQRALIATEQAIQLDELIKWVRAQATVDNQGTN